MSKNRLTFNQAAGKIREMKEKLSNGSFKSDVLKRIKDESKISIAPPRDRMAYLLNAINGLDEVTGHGERVFLAITGEISSNFTRKQIAKILKKVLLARINGWTYYQISTLFKRTEDFVKALEELARLELNEGLKAKGFVDILHDTQS